MTDLPAGRARSAGFDGADGVVSPCNDSSDSIRLSSVLEHTPRLPKVEWRDVQINQRYEDDTIIKAPFDGVVTVKSAQPGEIVSPQFLGGGGIAKIVDMDSRTPRGSARCRHRRWTDNRGGIAAGAMVTVGNFSKLADRSRISIFQ